MRVLLIKATVTSKYSSIVFEMVLMETFSKRDTGPHDAAKRG